MPRLIWTLLPVLLGWLAACDAAENPPETEPLIEAVEGLFDQDQPATLGLGVAVGENVTLYRASAAGYKFCHHANIGVFKNRLYAMWSNGIEHEDHNGQRILYATSEDGIDWSEPGTLAPDPDGLEGTAKCVATGFRGSGEVLIAYYTVVNGDPGSTSFSLYARSSKNGVAWSEAQEVVTGSFLEAPRALQSGDLLLNGQSDLKQPRLLYSQESDGIRGWQEGSLPVTADLRYPEPTWFQRRDGTVVMLFRSENSNPWLYASISTDDGRTWTPATQTNFADATARSFAGNLPDGSAFIINNPNQSPGSVYDFIGRRIPLTISLSRDGTTFDRAFLVRGEDTTMRFPGENKLPGWQYPGATVFGDHVYVVYSINKEDVGLTRIRITDLVASGIN